MTKQQYQKQCAAICASVGGVKIGDEWRIESPLGRVRVTVMDERVYPWVAVRFDTFSTGRVYDPLGGADFNGYSGKWNVHTTVDRGTVHENREAVVRELKRRLDWLMSQPARTVAA
jgi:hypothetical protein